MKTFVGNKRFVVMLYDDLMEDNVPLTQPLINDYETTHASILAVKRVPHKDVSAYGVIDPEAEEKSGLFNVRKFVEKPAADKALSDLAIIGRYFLTLPHKLDILMFSIILIPWVQSNLGEFYLTYQMNIHIIKDIILETIMILVFMFSSWRLLFPWSIFCYSSVLLVYLA